MEDLHLQVAHRAVRWLVYNDTISLEGIRCVPLAVEAATWLGALLAAIVALVLIWRTVPQAQTTAVLLAAFALVTGYLGLLTPFRFWPQISYCGGCVFARSALGAQASLSRSVTQAIRSYCRFYRSCPISQVATGLSVEGSLNTRRYGPGFEEAFVRR
jgi:hypothetical protein